MLNKRDDYAEIHGNFHGASFVQNGLYFDATGHVIVDKALPYSKEERARAETMHEVDQDEPDLDMTKKGLDLRLWAMAREQADFKDVRSQIQDKFGKKVISVKQALTFLQEKGVVSEKDLAAA